MAALDPELALLTACASWPPCAGRVALVRRAAEAVTDWDRFQRIVLRHRMAGMAINGLSAAEVVPPPEADRQLRRVAQSDLFQALSTASEAGRLIRLLADERIGAMVLKGPPLAALIYGTQAVRQVRDLDLLVDPGDLAHAIKVVQGQGYALQYEGSDQGLRPDQSVVMKDVMLVHPATQMVVELHGRLSENAELLPTSLTDAAVPVAIGSGLSLPALTGDPLLLYLMVHGFRHGWYRLKWLADVAAIVQSTNTSTLDALVADAKRRGLYVVVASTFLVLVEIMDVTLPPALVARVRRDRRARLCAGLAVRRIRDEREPDQQILSEALTTAVMFLASPRPAYLVRELRSLLIDNLFVVRFGGGKGVEALSIALRPLLWSTRKFTALVRARRPS